MAEAKRGDRALGPELQPDGKWTYRYPKDGSYPGYFMVITLSADRGDAREQKKLPFKNEAEERAKLLEARAFVTRFNDAAQIAEGVTIEEAMLAYPAYLLRGELTARPGVKQRKGHRYNSTKTTIYRLRDIFPAEALRLPDKSLVPIDSDIPGGKKVHPTQWAVGSIDEATAMALHECLTKRKTKRGKVLAGDTVVGTVAAARKFFAFCVEKKWARTNPFDGFRPVADLNPGGKGMQHGTYEELAKLRETAYELAEGGDVGAAALLIAQELNPRAELIVTRRARDIDLDGAILHTKSIDPRWNPTKRTPLFLGVMNPRLREILLSLKLGLAPDQWVFPASRRVRPGRRNFSENERTKILEEYDAAILRRAGKEVLNRYGIDAALIFAWRRRKPSKVLVPAIELPPLELPADRKGHRDPSWVRDQVKRICALAGVSTKTHAHGLRGAAASSDIMGGDTIAAVQAKMGHSGRSNVLGGSYVRAEAIQRRRQLMYAEMTVMDGGKED